MRRGGFFIYEMLIGMMLLAAAGLVLVVASTRVHVASSRLADARAATRAAEAALSDLQSGRPPTGPAGDAQIAVRPTAASHASLEGWQWIDVTAKVRGQARTLTGLVPHPTSTTAPAEGGAR